MPEADAPAPQIPWTYDVPANPPTSIDIAPIPVYVPLEGLTPEGEPPYPPIRTKEEIEAQLEAQLEAERQAAKARAANPGALMSLVEDVMKENGLDGIHHEIVNTPDKDMHEEVERHKAARALGAAESQQSTEDEQPAATQEQPAVEAPQAPEAPAADTVETPAATALFNLLQSTMAENGLKDEFVALMNSPSEEFDELPQAYITESEDGDVSFVQAAVNTEAPVAPMTAEMQEASDDAEAPQKGMRFGILRASAWLARGRDAVLKHTVGRVAQTTQETTEQATEEQRELTRNEKIKKAALWAAVGAGAVVAAGVTVYLQNKGMEFIKEHSVSYGFGGSNRGNGLGRQIGEMAGQHGSRGPKGGALGASEGIQFGLGDVMPPKFTINAGDTPWSVLTRNGVGGDQVYNHLTDAAQHLQADKGIPFEWHGTGTGMWLEVGGKSDTQSAMDALSPYL